jgi:hypothetical protein
MARRDGKAEVQHYVPQILLRLHATAPSAKRGAEQIWCFDKKTNRVFSPNIKGVVAGSRFYEVDVDGVELTLEGRLGRLETKVSPILTRIVEKRCLSELDMEARGWVAKFAAVQAVRTQAFREYILDVNHSLATRLREDGIDLSMIANYQRISEEDAKKVSLRILDDADKNFAPYFLNKHWYLTEGRVEDPFHLGDNPIVRENQFASGPATMGLASPGISIYLPLCPTLCLGMIDPAVADDVKKRYGLVRQVHDQLHRFVKENSRRLGMDALVDPITELVGVTAFLEGTLPCPYDPEVVARVNSLQMMYATRWVMSSRNDFSLPRRMITDDERFHRGLTAEFVRVEIDDRAPEPLTSGRGG